MVTRNKRSPDEKIRIIMESLATNITVAELCRKHNLHPLTFYRWKERFIGGGKTAMTGANGDASKRLQKENEDLKRIIGELAIANDAFKKTLEGSKR